MSGMEDRRRAAAESAAVSERTAAALASIRARRAQNDGAGAAVMVAAMTFGEAAGQGRLRRAVAIAQGICIIAAGVIPVALFWAFAYPG